LREDDFAVWPGRGPLGSSPATIQATLIDGGCDQLLEVKVSKTLARHL
jgi:hypothetical protein